MSTRYRFFAPLTNVNDAITRVNFGTRISAVRRSSQYVVDRICDAPWMHPFHARVAMDGLRIAPEYVPTAYAFEATFVSHAKNVDHRVEEQLFDSARAEADRLLRILRLFREGDIHLPFTSWLVFNKRKLALLASWGDISGNTHVLPYELSGDDPQQVSALIRCMRNLTPPEYVKLAWDHFDCSYSTSYDRSDVNMFLSLSISLEALFNDGGQELSYRIARALAITLGETEYEAHTIFDTAKAIYNKRSRLVHTGNVAIVTFHDVLLLRSLLRRAIVKLAVAGLPKAELMRRITGAAFGMNIF